MREKALYHDYLNEIHSHCGDKELIPIKDAAAYLGVSVKTVKKHYPMKQVGRLLYVSAVELARLLA